MTTTPIMIASPTSNADTVTAFRDSFVDAGGDPREATVPFGLHTYVADSFEQAVACSHETVAPIATIEGDVLRAWIRGTQNGKYRRVEFPYTRVGCGVH